MDSADIIIIGGGAAGLMAAYSAAKSLSDSLEVGKSSSRGHRVVVFEKMPRPGRKIVITGKGRCNLTNMKEWNEFQEHVHPNARFLRPAFFNLPPAKLCDLLLGEGLETVVERGDRVFPSSHRSMDVVDTLVRMATSAGAEIRCNCEVTSCAPVYAGGAVQPGTDPVPDGFEVVVGGHRWRCRRLVVTTGGLSYPRTGSTGDGYAWAESLGHTLTPRFPSLTALIPKNYVCPGVSAKGAAPSRDRTDGPGRMVQLKNVEVSLITDGNVSAGEFGDIDFTDGGLEGPVGFKISRKAVRALMYGSKVSVSVDLKPAVAQDELEKRVKDLWDGICSDKRSEGKPYRTRFGVLLGKLLPQDVIPLFLQYNPECDHKRIAACLKAWRMDIVGNVGYERAVITAGGVSLDEVSHKTLESKKCPGLYLAGEILDLDADTGGYNLHIAFSTGWLAGLNAASTL